jgi:hypothetical protein
MNPPEQSPPARWVRAGYLVPLGLLLAAGFCVHGVTGYFRLSSETATLRQGVMDSAGGTWDKTIAVNIGGMTMGLVRLGARLFLLDPEPRAALETLRGAEVGVYKLQSAPLCTDRASVFATVDKAMAGRGWQRVVGVCKDQELVAVYVPRKPMAPRRMRACLMVWHDCDLVVASARGNLEPLMALAAERLDLSQVQRGLARQGHLRGQFTN